MTSEELLQCLAEKEDLEERDVFEFWESSNEQDRLLARKAVAKTLIRRALAATAELACKQHYEDPDTLSAIEALANIADVEEPYIETLKQLGLRAVAGERFEDAMQFLQKAIIRAILASNQRDSRSRRAMRYIYDEQIEAAVNELAVSFSAPPGRRSVESPLRLVVLCTAIQDEDGPTVLTYKRAVHFGQAGFDVEVVSTDIASSANSRMSLRLQEAGIPLHQAVGDTFKQKAEWLLSYFTTHPANAVSYAVLPHDLLAKLMSCIGVAPVQTYDCLAFEPLVGKYDLICHGVSVMQEVQTRWPGRSRYFGNLIAMAEEIDAATPLPRETLGVPEDAVLLATFGRMTKCDKPEYLEALARILAAEPRAWLILAGRDNFDVFPSIERHFRSHGVADRVRFLGPRQEDGPRLLKTVDVYCDTYPWPGGQSLGDAMQAGLPVVAMRKAINPELDPSGCGPTTAVAEVALGEILELADAGNVDDYVRIARAYINDPELRAQTGHAVREHAVRHGSMKNATIAFGEAIRELVLSKPSVET